MVVTLFPGARCENKLNLFELPSLFTYYRCTISKQWGKNLLKENFFSIHLRFFTRIPKNISYSSISWRQLFLRPESCSYFQLNYKTVFLVTFFKEADFFKNSVGNFSRIGTTILYNLKVSWSRKQILKFSFEPKIERKYFCISALALYKINRIKKMQIII